MKPEVLSEDALSIFCSSYGLRCDSSSSSGGILGQSHIVPPLRPKSYCRGFFSVGHVHTTSPGRTPEGILTTYSNHLIWLLSFQRSIGSTQSISDDWASYPTSQGERRYPAECSHPGHKELQPHSFCPYPQFMATIETFAFWLSALFRTTGQTKVHNTAATRTIRLLLFCSMLPLLVNKTPRYLNSSTPQYLITPPFSNRGLWILAWFWLHCWTWLKRICIFSVLNQYAMTASIDLSGRDMRNLLLERKSFIQNTAIEETKTSVPVTSPCRCPFVVLCICSFYKHALQHPDPLPWIDV